jgi:hypothetical protein
MDKISISDGIATVEIQVEMTRQDQWEHSVTIRFTVSVFERECVLESHLSIAPGEREDFFGERNEDHLLFTVEIRIDEAVQVTGERD